MSLPIALQLYSVRDDLEKDFQGTLYLVKEMGYEVVELSGLNGRDPIEVKTMLKKAKLSVISSHISYGELFGDLEGSLNRYKAVGCEYLAIAGLPFEKQPPSEAFKDVILEISKAGELASTMGITLLYHNHDFEFCKFEGEYALDLLYRSVLKEFLQTQLDTCWVNVAGEDPAVYMLKYKDRAPLLHLKDFHLEGRLADAPYELIGVANSKINEENKDNFQFRPIGYGDQNIPSIIKAAKQANTKWLIVEQDHSVDCTPLAAAKMSLDYLKEQEL